MDRLAHLRLGGTIPAGAGSRSTCRSRQCGTRDHPRWHGDQAWKAICRMISAGPSPQTRGAASGSGCAARSTGTIPAGAGAAVLHRVPGGTLGTIPAGAGNRPGSRPVFRLRWDQPPRTRETGAGHRGRGGTTPAAALDDTVRVAPYGTIPADAGSSPTTSSRAAHARDHPRGRGEQELTEVVRVLSRGPSPRARGAIEGADAGGAAGGTIPASAGSRDDRTVAWRGGGDHPCERREQTWTRERPFALTGPASAESRSRASSAESRPWDHPRGRGAVDVLVHALDGLGPSPRARGTGVRNRPAAPGRGAIAAGAGNRAAREPKRCQAGTVPVGAGNRRTA